MAERIPRRAVIIPHDLRKVLLDACPRGLLLHQHLTLRHRTLVAAAIDTFDWTGDDRYHVEVERIMSHQTQPVIRWNGTNQRKSALNAEMLVARL
jgi:hypothetical protein